MEVALTCLGIMVARIFDVSLGTMRSIFVFQGLKWLSLAIGFVEVLIWVLVVARVIATVPDNPLFAIAYAGGFAVGNFIGIFIESRIAFGRQVLKIFTRDGDRMAEHLRTKGLRVTIIDGRGRDGPVQILFVEVPRRQTMGALEIAREIDATCYFVVDDIRNTSGK
ncbi:MAG: DUF5698 domain-containing protein [Planctomycetota bacterium]|nr:DUF5698 domain-containing protein [Planctomycetota bacterium]